MAKVRSITSAKTAGPVGQLYKAFKASGARLCLECQTYVYLNEHRMPCDGIPDVLRRYAWEQVIESTPHVNPIDHEWTELAAEEANASPDAA